MRSTRCSTRSPTSTTRRSRATVDALTSLIEPLLIVVMGVIVGGMIISLYLPMFNIIKLIK